MKRRPTNKQIIEALNKNFSILVNSAQDLGITRQTLKKYIDNDPYLMEQYKEGKEKLKDLVEFQLLKNIKEGKETSLIWYMKTQMRDRNYIEHQEMNMTIDTVRIKYIIPEDQNKLDNKDVKIIGTSNDKLLNE